MKQNSKEAAALRTVRQSSGYSRVEGMQAAQLGTGWLVTYTCVYNDLSGKPTSLLRAAFVSAEGRVSWDNIAK